jgi:ABC-type multidrug transport system ATPase subunit
MQLVIRNLSKTYANGVQALKDVNLTIYEGMFGLLGPNGAGKSTLMRIIATLQDADSGSIMLGDMDVTQQRHDVRKILGYLPQEFGLYPRVSVVRLLDYLASIKGMNNRKKRKEHVEEILHRTNLWSFRNESLGNFSGGMKQRFGIAQALLGNPKLIIVDEPTSGLDPVERNRFLNFLAEMGEKAIVILSTHIVDDVRELCTNLAIINEGEVLYRGRTSDAMEKFEGKIWTKQVSKGELNEYKQRYNIIHERLRGGYPVIHVFSETQPDASFDKVTVELDDVYFAHIRLATKTNEITF